MKIINKQPLMNLLMCDISHFTLLGLCCYNVHMSHCYYKLCIVGFINIFVDV